MTLPLVSLAAMVCYLAAAYRTATSLASAGAGADVKRSILGIGLAAVTLHGLVLYHGVVTQSGFNLGVSSAASLVAWVIAVLIIVVEIYRPLESVVVVLLPLAALALALERLFPGGRMLPMNAPMGLRIHVLLSVVAYSVLTVAAIEAVLLAIADRRLHQHRPLAIMHLLPPLHTMEQLLFQLLGLGFFILSLGLISGFMFVEDLFAQHLVHKTVLSVVAWAIFAVLLLGRWRSGWRGRIAVRYTLSGFVVLMLAFFGSKIVLELILNRV